MNRVNSRRSHGRVLLDQFYIDLVSGNRGLAQVVQQVVGENLYRGHRQERDQRAGPHHAQHVAKVAAGTHPHVFEDIGEHLPPLNDPR